MSVVGPRPMFPEQWQIYSGTAYFDTRPGLTGLWQISRRSTGSFAERVNYDTDYVRNMSLRTDMRIMARTFGVVCRGTGV
jgi:lipopolysaccharide/colanic/teichoic acid biosynthesis glycosyltransferase